MSKAMLVFRFFMCATAIGIGGCDSSHVNHSQGNQQQSSDFPSAKLIAKQDSKHTDERHIHGSSQSPTHAPYQKPGAEVWLADTQPFRLAEPGAADLELRLLAPGASGKLLVDVSTSEGLELVNSTTYEFELKSAASYLLPIRVKARENGRFYINLRCRTLIDGREESRVLAAIVQVGADANRQVRSFRKLDKTTFQGSSASESRVIEMPAQETVRPGKAHTSP